MPNRSLTLLILVLTALSLSACGVVRRQDRREDRREERSDLLQKTTQAPAPALTRG